MNELALFAGAGGGLLATKWLLGWRTVCYVEKSPYRVKVLKARIRDGLLDDAPIWDDARTFDGKPWRGCVDIVTAGFPCQPFSQAGKQLADRDERNLWPDTVRIIREVRPRWILLENVSRLLSHAYIRRIFGDLAESGYDCRWDCIPASAIGANHQRDRIWIVAYANCQGLEGGGIPRPVAERGEEVADPDGGRFARAAHEQESQGFVFSGSDTAGSGVGGSTWWEVEPRLGRVADGMANQVERIAAIGDGQVPAVVRAVWGLLVGSEKGK